MPQGNARPTRVRLRTKKNPDGSQQYVRGNTAEERHSNAAAIATSIAKNGPNEAFEPMAKARREEYKPIDRSIKAFIKKRKDLLIRTENRDRSK